MQGKFLPDVIFKVREDGDWSDYTTEDYFRDGRSVLFSLPGAFTPTCTSYQLPGFDRMYDEFKEQGVDNIYCMSVNDSFVMNAWSKELAVGNVKMIPDGSGEFTRYMGMLIDKSHLGFGMRSWRYAAVIEHCQVIGWFEEHGINNVGSDEDPYEETTPENVLNWLKNAPKTQPSPWPFPKIGDSLKKQNL